MKVGNETSAVVESFEGLTRLDDSTNWDGVTIDSLAEDDKQLGEKAFRRFSEDYHYVSYESDYISDNVVQECGIKMPISKMDYDADMSIFTDYTILIGSRIYEDLQDDSPLDFEAKRFKFELKEPNYDLSDPTILDNFSTDDYSDDGAETEFLGGEKAEADATVLGNDFADSKVAQALYTGFISSTDINEDDVLSLFFEMDLPEDFIQDGQIITQYAQLSTSSVDLVMECTTQVGNPYFTIVNEYYGTTDPS